jgi:hypothetical protein
MLFLLMNVQFIAVQEEERLISGVKKIHIFTKKLVHNPPHVTIWAGLSGRHISGQYFFEGSVNQHIYLTMLKAWLVFHHVEVSQLEHMDLMGKVWFQLDIVPAHYTISVQEYLSDVPHDKWIGHGSPTLMAPQEWPPRNSDLSSCDNALWGIIKQDGSWTH